jgi:hypothetical protein
MQPYKAPSLSTQPVADVDDDEDDVQILLSQPLSQKVHKRRAVSLDSMEEDLGHNSASCSFARNELCSCPGPESSSICHSDDELHASSTQFITHSSSFIPSPSHRFSTSSTPALSHTLSDSTNSSLVSLALPPPTQSVPHPFQPALPSSCSEKAIAALSLAFANGAGLTDYGALLAIQATPALDDCQVGEMWH